MNKLFVSIFLLSLVGVVFLSGCVQKAGEEEGVGENITGGIVAEEEIFEDLPATDIAKDPSLLPASSGDLIEDII